MTQIDGCYLAAEFDFSDFAGSCSNTSQSCAVRAGDCPGTLTLGYVQLWSPEGDDFPLDVKMQSYIDPGSCQQTCGLMCSTDPNGCAPFYAGTVSRQ